jgi:hypothetical protein
MERVLTTAVAQSIQLELWLFIAVGPGELVPCTAVYSLQCYLSAGNRLLCFSMSNFPLPFYVPLFSHGSQYLTALHVRYKVCIPHFHLVF